MPAADLNWMDAAACAGIRGFTNLPARLRTTPGALSKALERAGHDDLKLLFEAEYKRTTVVCDADARRVVS